MSGSQLQHYIDNAELYWQRDWEFLFRAAELLRHSLNGHWRVSPRRSAYLSALDHRPIISNTRELKRYGDDFSPVIDWVAKRWATLFDVWNQDRSGYVFEDGFAVLFFLRVLWANERVVLRGHYNEAWRLTTTLARAQERGDQYVKMAAEAAQEFLSEVEKLPEFVHEYPRGLKETHAEALCQHYGFPTDFLDLTYSYDVALYFAEGGEDSVTRGPAEPERGAIYAFPINLVARNSVMVTLSPRIMRPHLQAGIFAKLTDVRVRDTLEGFKYRFRHLALPVCNGLGDIQETSSPRLSQYLFPVSDPIEAKAEPIRKDLAERASSLDDTRGDLR